MRTKYLTPIDIGLKDLPPEGLELGYTRETGELNEPLRDLIGGAPYAVQLKIMPMGNAYDLRGEIHTELPLQCSTCATEYGEKVNLNVHEMIVVQKPMAKGDQQIKANHAHELRDSGPDYITLESDQFQVGEYVHEAVALAMPIRPLCRPDCTVERALEDAGGRDWLSVGAEKAGDFERESPFRVLEKLKLKS